jgi:hypothetical protein
MQNDDVNFKGILGFLGILGLGMALAYGAITGMWRSFEKSARQSDAQILRNAPPGSAAAMQPYFPLPREQPNPVVDLQTLRTSEEAELNSYGWIDKTAGVVRIPIDRAIDIMLAKPQGGSR